MGSSLLAERLILETTPVGLTVCVIPKPNFVKKFAVLAARYGSINNKFRRQGASEVEEMPAGIAHFLEHKLFEKEDGNISDKFSQNGASVNAFTSHTVTAYYFDCADPSPHMEKFKENLNLLGELVFSPYITDETVSKEIPIIQQEISMCEDFPDWRLHRNLLASLYSVHPVRVDTAGTKESVGRITRDLLLRCHNLFYSPSNMLLVCAGDLGFEEVQEVVKRWSWSERALPPQTVIDPEPPYVAQKSAVESMRVHLPKILVGFKEPEESAFGEALVRRSIETDLCLSIAFGRSSRAYRSLYESSLIDDTFSFSHSADREFAFTVIGGDTPSPERLQDAILKTLAHLKRTGVPVRDFVRMKRKAAGLFVRSFNSLESVAVHALASHFLGFNHFESLNVLESVTVDDVNSRLARHFCEERMAVSTILPLSSTP
jgi:predicted Zn-dependent peptidase